MFCDLFSFKPDVYVGTLNLIASIPYLLLKGIVGHLKSYSTWSKMAKILKSQRLDTSFFFHKKNKNKKKTRTRG